ncbi:hemolysin III family channel protein [Xylariomycetidae sp. FL2044]|nr:hemolysin III family channel protein [Xylariomycetidae sp. FL2044]
MDAEPSNSAAITTTAGTSTNTLRKRRPSSSSTTTTTAAAAETLLQTAKAAEHHVEEALRLLLWDDLPAWRRDNAYITRGYRPPSSSIRRSLASGVLGLHNETVNVWTHLVGALLFPLLGLYLYLKKNGGGGAGFADGRHNDALVLACFFGGAVACLGMSATYHALTNHSEAVARRGNKLDYTGIVLLIVGSYVPALYYGFSCHRRLMAAYLGAICVLGAACAVVSWVERFRTPAWRPYRAAVFVGLGASGVVPVAHALSLYGYRALDDRMGLGWVLLEGALYIFGAFLYAARWPERTSPGTYDIWGSSHQLFHVLIVLAAAAHLTGMVKAFDYHHSAMRSQC